MITQEEIDERNAVRDQRALEAACRIVETRGLSALTRDAIADEANLSPASVSNFGRHRISNGTHAREGYRSRILRAMMDLAVEKADVRMLRVGLADGCLKPDAIPIHLRAAAGV
jgi:AcrR family transcriptional regulator